MGRDGKVDRELLTAHVDSSQRVQKRTMENQRQAAVEPTSSSTADPEAQQNRRCCPLDVRGSERVQQRLAKLEQRLRRRTRARSALHSQ